MTTTSNGKKPLLCRLNIHHVWRRHRTADGETYRECERCGKDHPGSFGNTATDIIGGGL